MLRRIGHAAFGLMTALALTLGTVNAEAAEMTGKRETIATGTLVKYQDVPSAHVPPRNVTVWLPPGYEGGTGRYSVLYMHDGQNVFEGATAYGGQEWGVDEALSRLMAEGKVRDTIVVGVWNTSNRYLEYYPQAAFERLPEDIRAAFQQQAGGTPVSDAYLTFLVTELKPYIDRTYRTRPGRDDTFLMGSSMGGLISTYALIRQGETFGAVGAVSTHWPMARPDQQPESMRAALFGAMLATVAEGLTPAKGRIWFDFGTVNLDSFYEPLQVQVDAVMAKNGFTRGKDWMTEKFEGADHNEVSWRQRVHQPLEFLLRP
ncbi:MAG: hypothetical protein RLY86_1676 [Pseudomonadota bacterium]